MRLIALMADWIGNKDKDKVKQKVDKTAES